MRLAGTFVSTGPPQATTTPSALKARLDVEPAATATTFDSPGLQGPSVLAMTPLTFTLPAAGGTQALAGAILDAGDGFTTSGTLTLAPVA